MRRKPMHNGGRQNNNGGGHNGGQRRHNGGGYNNNRPRKNYPQLREKYLNQAKDALSVGDRVMAEYYFQHADHCYRMMLEDGYRPHAHQSHDAQQDTATQEQGAEVAAPVAMEAAPVLAEESMPNAGALPNFLTMGYTAAAASQNIEHASADPAQGQWEEN